MTIVLAQAVGLTARITLTPPGSSPPPIGARTYGNLLDPNVRNLPERIAAGAFILNSGMGKWSADDETAAQLHGFAVGTYPFLGKLKPKDFVRLLAATEIALGAALLLPVVPPPWPAPG